MSDTPIIKELNDIKDIIKYYRTQTHEIRMERQRIRIAFIKAPRLDTATIDGLLSSYIHCHNRKIMNRKIIEQVETDINYLKDFYKRDTELQKRKQEDIITALDCKHLSNESRREYLERYATLHVQSLFYDEAIKQLKSDFGDCDYFILNYRGDVYWPEKQIT